MPRKNHKKSKPTNSKKPTARKKVTKTTNVLPTVEGVLDITKGGRAFVKAIGSDQDIIIPFNSIGKGFHGDTVEVKVLGRAKNGRWEGEVKKVLKRAQKQYIGRFMQMGAHYFVEIKSDKPINDFYIDASLKGQAENGQFVIVEYLDWPAKAKNPFGKVVKIVNETDLVELEMQSIIIDNGFTIDFPEQVLAESEAIPVHITSQEIAKRTDFRDVLTFTVDPFDAKDFDDAISYRALEDDWIELGIHIADVSHYVTEGTALDNEALNRATSVYLPDRVVPMLPERLSNELCSLRPNEEKLTFSCVFTISKTGAVKDVWIGRTIICSDKRYTYEEAQTIIETNQPNGPIETAIVALNAITRQLRKTRFDKGAINFSSQEVRFKLDEQGVPIGVVIKESKEAHQMIEECMLLANKYVAHYVVKQQASNAKIAFPFRVHDVPNEEKLTVFAAFARKFGYQFKTDTPEDIQKSFNELLSLLQDKPERHILETLGIRTMAKAEYATNNIGHYGLGFEDYCHFTSPIRRYPDVMVHRVVDQLLRKQYKEDDQMDEKCSHCSSQERKAMDVERQSNKLKQVQYMAQFIGDTFDAVVSGVSTFGFWAETVDAKCEGLISLERLSDIDHFEHDTENYLLRGIKTGIVIRMGDRVRVKLLDANIEKRYIDFGLEELIDKSSQMTPVKKRSSKTKK